MHVRTLTAILLPHFQPFQYCVRISSCVHVVENHNQIELRFPNEFEIHIKTLVIAVLVIEYRFTLFRGSLYDFIAFNCVSRTPCCIDALMFIYDLI